MRRPQKPGRGQTGEKNRHAQRPPRSQAAAAAAKGPRQETRSPRQQHHAASSRHGSHKRQKNEHSVRLFGIHAVEAALLNDERIITRLLLTDNAAKRLTAVLVARGISPEPATPNDLDRLLGADQVHQGALLETEYLPEPDLTVLAQTVAPQKPLVILDQVTDPHNVGAMLRSAAVFGASGLIMTRRNSPPLAGVLAKSASGGLEHVPVAFVTNLAQAMSTIRDHGIQLIGLDGSGETALDDAPLTYPMALILGAEGAGLRRLTRDNCDRLCRLSTHGPLCSLNVSNAAAVALHLATCGR